MEKALIQTVFLALLGFLPGKAQSTGLYFIMETSSKPQTSTISNRRVAPPFSQDQKFSRLLPTYIDAQSLDEKSVRFFQLCVGSYMDPQMILKESLSLSKAAERLKHMKCLVEGHQVSPEKLFEGKDLFEHALESGHQELIDYLFNGEFETCV